MLDSNAQIKNIFIPFNVLINTDIGVLKTVQNKFNNKDLIDDKIYYNSDNRILYHILNRNHPNVLSLVIRDYENYNINKTLDDLYEENTNDILEHSSFTNIINICIVGGSITSLNIDIWCRNEIEKQFIMKNTSYFKCSFNPVIKDSMKDFNFDKYDSVFIESVLNIKDILPKLIGKSLYILKARYNLDMLDSIYSIPRYITEVIPESMISLVSPYVMDETFFIDG